MELLERYLQAISTFLRGKNSTDILRELREDILSQMEEKEVVLGRPLTAMEQEDIIRQHGHPIVVAARYSPQRYLIGPTLFPFYGFTLVAALLMALVGRAVVVLVTILVLNDSVSHAVSAFAGIPGTLLSVFAGVTISFAVFEYMLATYKISGKLKWQPSKLPALRGTRRTVSRAESAAGLIFGMAAAIWWQALPFAPVLILGPGALFVEPGPVWRVFHVPVLAVIVTRALLCGFDLLRPHVSAAREWVELGFKAAEIVLLGLIFQAGNWVTPAASLPDPAKVAHIVQILNQYLRYTFAVLLLVMLFQVVKKCYRLYRASRRNAAGMTAATLA